MEYCHSCEKDMEGIAEIAISIGKKHLHFKEIDSTNTYLKEHGKELPNGTTVTADYQFAGKGRLGRQWEDGSKNSGEDALKCSILLKGLSLEKIPQLPAVTGLGVCLALEKLFGEGFLIKWPNDIIYNKKKICGILCESRVSPSHESETSNCFAVCGFGINLAQTSGYFQENQLHYASSIYLETGIIPDVGMVYKKVLDCFEQIYLSYLQFGFSNILGMYQEKCATLGKEVIIQDQGQESSAQLIGTALRIDQEGQLICLVGEKEVVVRAGEASVRGLYGCLL